MQAYRSRFMYSALNFNAEKDIKYREWSSFFFCESLTCPQLMMIPALAATQIPVAIPVPQTVDIRKCAALSDVHTSSGSVDAQTPAQTPAVVPLTSSTPVALMGKNYTPPSLASQSSISKRLSSEISRGQVPTTQLAKKRKVVGFSASAVPVPRGSAFILASSANVPGPGISPDPVRTQTRGTSGKRFRPPKMMRPTPETKEAQMTSILHGEEGARTGAQLTAIRHQYLDFPAPMVPPALSPITLPPSLAERRLVQRWAVILSGLSEKERFRCCFVSKLIRYAGKCRLLRNLDSMHTEP